MYDDDGKQRSIKIEFWTDRSMTNKLLFILFKLQKVLYNSAYFYFFPFLVLWISIVIPQFYTFFIATV